MSETVNRQILLASRPIGMVKAGDFTLAEASVPEPDEGQVLRKTIYLSLDPYMRGRMTGAKTYAEPVGVGDVMCGGTVSRVLASRHADLCEGDVVLGYDGWREFACDDGAGLRKLDPTAGVPMSYFLGVLGMPGFTAYVGLLDIGRPTAGETVLVSAAAGAVGSTAGQIARIHGCRVVGTAGTDAKCEYVVTELGFDACVNYKGRTLLRDLRRACPDGIDVYVENVGGPLQWLALRLMNDHGRIPLIGLISLYNATEPPPGTNLVPVLIKRLTIRGMIIHDHEARLPAFLADMTGWIRDGKVKTRETIVEGLPNAPTAFGTLFTGEKLGKLIVQVSEDPDRP